MKMQMANQCLQMGQLDQAITLYKQVLTSEPENAAACSSLGIIYNAQAKHALAIECLTKAIELKPDNINAHLKLANSLRDHGLIEQAIDHYRHILKLRPGHAEALVTLAIISKCTTYNDEIRLLEDIYRQPELPRDTRKRLAYALGKTFDDLREYDKAFEYLVEGNRISHEDHSASIEAVTRDHQGIQTVFDVEFFRKHSSIGITDNNPIIITGMPRSGTSLIEQILASHPDVYGAGEADNFHRIAQKMQQTLGTHFPVGFDKLDKNLLQGMATQYVTELKNMANHERFITDKNLGSNWYIGLISVILPNVKIIHCKRDPRDQGLSFFQQNFRHHQPNSYDLTEIGQYYRICQTLMEHWDHMLPGKIFEIQYEDLVADLEAGTRRLLDYCDLPFNNACLDFHETERTVNTASLAQVRQPLYSSSVGRWKNYEKHLQPLFTALQQDLPE